jgi:hypothetical protein
LTTPAASDTEQAAQAPSPEPAKSKGKLKFKTKLSDDEVGKFDSELWRDL